MVGDELLTSDRLVSLATGRSAPVGGEWPIVILLLAVFAVATAYLLLAFGLTRFEAFLLSLAAPLMLLIDVPLGSTSPGVALAVNAAGGLIPFIVCVKIVASGRVPGPMLLGLIAVGTLASYLSSEVVPTRGVLLHYRAPAIIIGLLAATLWYRRGMAAGAGAYVAGATGVIIGADLVRLGELAGAGSASRIVIGGAGLLDGIYLVGFLSAGIAAGTTLLIRWVVSLQVPRRASV